MSKKMKGQTDFSSLIGMGLFGMAIGAWLTHVIVCLGTGKWGFLVAGALFFPVAIVHGIGVWFGAW